MNVKSSEWGEDRAIDVFRQAMLAELYGYHLFETENRSYYSFQSHETGDSVWLVPLPSENTNYQVRRFEEARKFPPSVVIPRPCDFERRVPIQSHRLEDGEIKRIESELRKGGEALGQDVNQAFVDVLMASVDINIDTQGRRLSELIAQVFDDLAQAGFTADTFLFPKRFKGKLLVHKIVVPDKEIQSNHYVGETVTGLRAFWSSELPDDTALVFDSTAGLTITQEPKFWWGKLAPSTLVVCGELSLNPIVKNTQAIIALEGIEQALALEASSQVSTARVPQGEIMYVDSARIDELRAITSPSFDLVKLIKLCEELNACYANSCFLAVTMLTRAILDHVPPILGCRTFKEVANNYGGRSFKSSMQHLQKSLRNIADSYLHLPIRSTESLPTEVQVNFSNDLDVLLQEIARVLR